MVDDMAMDERAHTPASVLERDAPATMARILAALFLAGAATGALTLLLPHSGAADDAALWSNVALAFVAAIGLFFFAPKVNPTMLQIIVAVGTLTVTRAVYEGGYAGTFYSLWYVWVGLFAFFAFDRAAAIAQLGLVAVTYAWALTQLPPNSSVVRWIMTVGTVAIGGLLVEVLIGRIQRREAASRARARALELVFDAAHELGRQTSSEAAGTALCKAAARAASGSDAAVLWEPTNDGRALAVTSATVPGRKSETVFFVESGSPLLDTFASGRPRFVRGDTTRLLQPLILDEVTVGVLAIEWAGEHEMPSTELSQVIGLLSLEGALALERASTLVRLERVARTDDLTGLANRRSWDEHLAREVARAKRTGSSLAIALLDLDHFKDYNDINGHPAGDRLLKQVAAGWSGAIRATDILARYGGEEFAVALPGVSEEEARATLERMREVMPEEQRVSAGLVFWDGDEGEVALVGRADRALYAAKAAGRDRVLIG
jgi:diguanylate cyclase (GGDEF)-like protein